MAYDQGAHNSSALINLVSRKAAATHLEKFDPEPD